jgi:hypothetical protein
MIRAAMVLLCVLSFAKGAWATDFYEVQIYTVDTAPEGHVLAEDHSILVGNQEHNTFEFTYGITPYLEIGQYLCTAKIANNYEYAGARSKVHFGIPATFDWPIALGANIEFDYMRRQAVDDPLSLEVMPIAQARIGRLFLVGNFVFSRQFSGPGTHGGIGFEPMGQISYLLWDWFEPAIEYYGDIGAIRSPLAWPHEQQFIVPSVNLHFSFPLEFNFGVGFGLTRAYPDSAFYKGTIGWTF